MRYELRMILYFGFFSSVFAFSSSPTAVRRKVAVLSYDNDYLIPYRKSGSTHSLSSTELAAVSSRHLIVYPYGNQNYRIPCNGRWTKQAADKVFIAVLFVLGLHIAVLPALADEYGVEKEAPTIFTGETVEICTKRGPLGACLKTEMRTQENDNDIAKKYFRDPALLIQQQKTAMLQGSEDIDGNELIQKLRQQSIDNREKNDLYVARKTFEADQSATFGPFDRQVLIMNTDGKTYTLLDSPVAMRLKKAGFIDGQRSFVKQPTQADLDAASIAEPGIFSGLFGGADASTSSN